jgi:hypothetical protein
MGMLRSALAIIEDLKSQANATLNIELLSADLLNKADIDASCARERYDVRNLDLTGPLRKGIYRCACDATQRDARHGHRRGFLLEP